MVRATRPACPELPKGAKSKEIEPLYRDLRNEKIRKKHHKIPVVRNIQKSPPLKKWAIVSC